MRTEIFSILTAFLLVCGCNSGSRTEGTAAVSLDGTETESAEILPITGTIAHLTTQLYGNHIEMAQGLGTGLLYTDNIDMPLCIKGQEIWHQ